jgi:hypothetical protein
MKTEELIQALAADNTRPVVPIDRLLMGALAVGAAASVILFGVLLGPRADVADAVHSPAFLLKLLVAMSLAVTSAAVLVECARPLPRLRRSPLLWLAPLLMLAGVVAELTLTPAALWPQRLLGHAAARCLLLIPLLSLAPAAALLLTLRRGAPARPALAGAFAGLVAGGVAAALYALNCREDSPLFVATWYTLAVVIVTGLSAFIGSRALRW